MPDQQLDNRTVYPSPAVRRFVYRHIRSELAIPGRIYYPPAPRGSIEHGYAIAAAPTVPTRRSCWRRWTGGHRCAR